MSVDEIFRSDGHSQSADGDHWKRENQGPPQRDDRTEGVAPEAWVDDLDDGVFECLFFVFQYNAFIDHLYISDIISQFSLDTFPFLPSTPPQLSFSAITILHLSLLFFYV